MEDTIDTTENSETRERKPRSDKGSIMATRRDLYCIAWIAEQYAARVDQIRHLLSRFPDAKRPFKGKLIAETTVKDQIARWKQAGWVEYKRVLADEPGFVWPTKKGLQLVDLDDLYTARVPASTRFDHIYAVNHLRLFLDCKYTWKSERRYRAETLANEKPMKGKSPGPLPDAVVMTKDGEVAIEVELSIKKPVELEAKLIRLVQHSVWDDLRSGEKKAFPLIWVYVPSEKMKAIVEDAIGALREDEQARVSIGVEDTLIASKFR